MATVNIQLSEFSELCRLCGSKTSVLMGLHIFEREGNLRQIYKKITACLPIQVHNSDKLPKMVCEECVYKLDALFEFRERSMKTEYELNNMLKDIYVPVCTESLPIQMDSLICDSSNGDNIQVQNGIEVAVSMDNEDTQHLDDIVMSRINDNSSSVIKCEPEMVMKMEKSPGGGSKVTQVTVGGHFSPDDVSAQGAPDVSDSDTLDHEGCSLEDTIGAELNVQDIRTLESMDETSMKSAGDVGSTNGSDFLVHHTQPEQPWFFCDICGKPFDNSAEFREHCERHWKKCGACGVSCANDDALLAHVRQVHTVEEEIIPTTSPPITNGQATVQGTLSGAQEDEKKNKSDTNKPAGKGTGEMKSCPECGKKYRTNYKLAEHMRKHTGEKPFKCSMCEKAFRSKIGLAQHEAKHTGQFDYTCSTCGKGFQCKSYLIVHQRVHSDLKPYPCETCGRNFKSKQSLLDHQNRHLGVKPYLCEICGRGFITKGLCKSHQKVHSGTDNRQYPCTVCNKLFVSKSYLATHLRIHTGEKPFMCEVCGKGFLTRVDLRIHSTMHTGEKSFVCEICGKAFARRDALRCHKRSHTGERPYRCDICGQGFTQFSPMAIHKRLHTGERPYACDLCSKTFVSRSTMMSHRKKHTS